MQNLEEMEEQPDGKPVKTLEELKKLASDEADLLERRLTRLEEALGLNPII
ncbi:hypothetical protein [Pseudomonas sp. p21]|uniref:hypothetical protein n=1 Tax=Pseudomonas sp. p21 TaxID=1825979 RepID=UPI0012E8C6B2|nr:hypothetical protein [Pseudomonas sp. p21]